jgi:hypothetical protein
MLLLNNEAAAVECLDSLKASGDASHPMLKHGLIVGQSSVAWAMRDRDRAKICLDALSQLPPSPKKAGTLDLNCAILASHVVLSADVDRKLVNETQRTLESVPASRITDSPFLVVAECLSSIGELRRARALLAKRHKARALQGIAASPLWGRKIRELAGIETSRSGETQRT